ncbi:PHD finger protein 20, transcript variant X2 [Columba livia]|uniref:PHD finger protein 20 n=1 Tax=Columba livia TaxID=8932 RepID=A0A2I0LNY1_COLLI|nr:PHD finger protein 20 isoform X5 [Columba livia]XP_021137957.1 PHD finger protein 20 isoform X5 [Columba livia]XP_021137958.1 PHD finger protein 20 isoform X5 [Columba livia]XP_021137959.1 PHD finger protein 20 isoform X5 [Columba livia]XP_021137960.1 PHD finger protein 20 isoform X5 [Columba livia]PKK19140.1 PHD finger protein 20, transcript variant X1 [Columba livia]PKK19143.1 PHD finger protein 20, transcript variant X2 [Columba livia]
MTKHPPNRRGINFEVGAQLEARDRLKNWYPAHIEEIDYEEGKVLIHFKRWNHRYDEWFCWDSPYLRPLEKIQLRKEGLHEEEDCAGFHINDQVLACWSDCRFYPAKVTSVNKDGTYTVKFYDGVVQTVKNIHVKAFSKDQSIEGNAKPKERGNEIPSSPEKQEKFKEQRKATGNAKKDKDEKTLKTEKRVKQPDKEGKLIVISEKGKVSEKNISKNGKEDKENISENDMEYSVDTQIEKKPENDSVKSPQENAKETKRKRGRPPITPPTEPSSQTLQPITLELRRRKIPKGGEVPSKRPRIEKNFSPEKLKNSSDHPERDQIRRRSSRLSSSIGHEILNTDCVTTSTAIQPLKDAVSNQKESEQVQLEIPVQSDQSFSEQAAPAHPSHSTALSAGDGLQEGEVEDTESSSVTVRTQEPPAATVTKPCRRTDFLESKKAATADQDHKFRCKFLDCLKSFRKAKLLHYHMKYFHGVENAAASQQNPVKRNIQTRASLASEKGNQERSKRGRTAAGSLYAPLHIALRSTPSRDEKLEKRRTSTPVSALNSHRHSVRDQTKNHIARSLRKPQENVENAVKEHEKNKERKSKDCGRSKSKKKKKKKKRTKPDYSGSEENTDVSQELSPEKSIVTKCVSSNKSSAHPGALLHCSDSAQHRGKSKPNGFCLPALCAEDDTLSESSLDSLLWSDDDASQDVDVTTNPDEEAEESDFEIVRCICEVKEENDFMIQCEECLCWQHGVCMGLLEDNVPEKYTCYICQDPPGQRSSLKYWYEKEWLSNGHMHGLAFVEDNYSHQNAKKIVATHQLLGDVQRVIEVLHGLQLKMSILQNRDHPDLKLWCHPWKHIAVDENVHTKHIIHIEENCCKEETASYRTWNGTVEKPSAVPSVEESYITSEHCYQKPRAYYPAIEQRLVVETRGSAMDDGVNRIRENGDDALSERFGWNLDREICKMENESKHSYSKVKEPVSKKVSPEEAIEMKLLEKDKEGVVNSQLQWQLNLLAHVESLQDEVIHRMDFIEKELDVLESWLDYTGELEPPEPLARLPQLKHCIKQLITDLGKVQQIALCCST